MQSKKENRHEEALHLYTKAKEGGSVDIDKFCSFYLKHFPNNQHMVRETDKSTNSLWKRHLHTMYLHLTR